MGYKNTPHYINNKEFHNEMVAWLDSGVPKIPDCLARKFLLLVERYGNSAGWRNYTWLDEMKGDAIIDILRYAKNYNPEKYQNPLAYFTQYAWSAFVRRMYKEEKNYLDRLKYIQNSIMLDDIDSTSDASQRNENQTLVFLQGHVDEEIKKIQTKIDERNAKRKAKQAEKLGKPIKPTKTSVEDLI